MNLSLREAMFVAAIMAVVAAALAAACGVGGAQ